MGALNDVKLCRKSGCGRPLDSRIALATIKPNLKQQSAAALGSFQTGMEKGGDPRKSGPSTNVTSVVALLP
jgi:hypothetical protein